jgi:CHAT domain-containing protein
LARLPFTSEIEAMRNALPPSRIDILRGFDASIDALGGHRLSDYAIVHLSTHSLIDDVEPQMSHIALSLVNPQGTSVEGLMRPDHLADWRLRGSLVVLSSCETALGKQILGEGLAGFTTSLFLAGASQVVLSTSKVDAEASADFFKYFYRNYLHEGKTLEASLTDARRVMASSRRWADPYYWASFVAIGRISKR